MPCQPNDPCYTACDDCNDIIEPCLDVCATPIYTEIACLNPINDDCVSYTGADNACLGIVKPIREKTVFEKVILFIRGLFSSITSNSLVFTPTQGTCTKTGTIELVPSANVGNILTLGTDGRPFVPVASAINIQDTSSIDLTGNGNVLTPLKGDVRISTNAGNQTSITPSGIFTPATALPPPLDFCSTFTNNVQQNNTVDPTTYQFIGLNDSSCGKIKITAPTGFAVTGNTRVSAFGKMEWFNTLTLANAAAIAGETVLIYNDTTENLILKSNVNYQGVGFHSIGNISTITPIVGNINLSNIKVINLVLNGSTSISNPTNYIANNVVVIGNADFFGFLKWEGGAFTGEVVNPLVFLQISSSAYVTKIYSRIKVIILDNGSLSHSTIIDTSVFDGSNTVYLNNVNGPNSICTLNQCYVSSINNSGVESYLNFNSNLNIVTNNVIKTGTKYGLRVHGGIISIGTSSVCTNNMVSNIGDNIGNIPNGAIILYNVESLSGSISPNTENYLITNNTGYSVNGPGIVSVLSSMKSCHGYSVNGPGILINSQEEQSTNLYITECTGDSKNSYGISTFRDTYIVGGTYNSRGVASNGNPIKISRISQNSLSSFKYIISGVNTIASDVNSYAISASSAITLKIFNCSFHNENNTGTILGIDTSLITLLPVVIDAYGNTK